MTLRDEPAMNPDFGGMSNGCATVAAMYIAAQRGNVSAAHWLATIMGETEAKVTLELPTIIDDIPRATDLPKA